MEWSAYHSLYIKKYEFLNHTVEELDQICKDSKNSSRQVGKKMNMIITMEGLGIRFRRAGYKMPKYMIEARGKTLFEWSMDSLPGYNGHVSKYV